MNWLKPVTIDPLSAETNELPMDELCLVCQKQPAINRHIFPSSAYKLYVSDQEKDDVIVARPPTVGHKVSK